MEEKQVFYNGKNYSVPFDSIKSINKTDVVKINYDTVIFWNKKDKCWSLADEELKNKYLNLIPGKLKLNGSNDLIEIKIPSKKHGSIKR